MDPTHHHVAADGPHPPPGGSRWNPTHHHVAADGAHSPPGGSRWSPTHHQVAADGAPTHHQVAADGALTVANPARICQQTDSRLSCCQCPSQNAAGRGLSYSYDITVLHDKVSTIDPDTKNRRLTVYPPLNVTIFLIQCPSTTLSFFGGSPPPF